MHSVRSSSARSGSLSATPPSTASSAGAAPVTVRAPEPLFRCQLVTICVHPAIRVQEIKDVPVARKQDFLHPRPPVDEFLDLVPVLQQLLPGMCLHAAHDHLRWS